MNCINVTISYNIYKNYNINNCLAITDNYQSMQEAYIVNPDTKIINSNIEDYLEKYQNYKKYDLIYGLHKNDHINYFKDIF